MTKKRISIQTREARLRRNRRYHYYSTTPLANLIKPTYHHLFRRWYENELKKFLVGAEGVYYSELCYLDFNLKAYGKNDFYVAFVSSLAKFLDEIGRSDGLSTSISMIFRYITDKNHSNLPMAESTLKGCVYKAFQCKN